jgi:hypothetical protein
MRQGAVRGVLCCVALAGILAACGSRIVPFCAPPELMLSAEQVSPGDSVTLSAEPASCEVSQDPRPYDVALVGEIGQEPIDLGHTVADPHGAFELRFAVPPGTRPGTYTVVVSGSVMDDCTDTRGGSCAGYGHELDVEP